MQANWALRELAWNTTESAGQLSLGIRHFIIGVLVAIPPGLHAEAGALAMSEEAFRKHSGSKGVLLLHVNWGRRWNCHGYENAQLQKLTFQLMSPTLGTAPEEISLDIPSKLRAKDAFRRYALLISPGEYGLSGFRFKLAASASDLRIYELDASRLIEDGKSKGGSFRVAAGEIVYVGHFGVDCGGEPTPWRFYIESSEDFSEYSAEFHREFPFTQSLPVIFRLFETNLFGKAYALPVATEEKDQPTKTIEPAR